jgi:hypothetical protein
MLALILVTCIGAIQFMAFSLRDNLNSSSDAISGYIS